MNPPSAAQFETNSRIHLALAVKSVDRSIAFYTSLFGRSPTKVRPGYARFEVAEPPVNLSLNEVGGETGPNHPVAHFGIQLKSSESVNDIANRLHKAGLETRSEVKVACCYSVQDKVWVSDPDGNNWEIYILLDDVAPQLASSGGSCCSGGSMNIGTVQRAAERAEEGRILSTQTVAAGCCRVEVAK